MNMGKNDKMISSDLILSWFCSGFVVFLLKMIQKTRNVRIFDFTVPRSERIFEYAKGSGRGFPFQLRNSAG